MNDNNPYESPPGAGGFNKQLLHSEPSVVSRIGWASLCFVVAIAGAYVAMRIGDLDALWAGDERFRNRFVLPFQDAALISGLVSSVVGLFAGAIWPGMRSLTITFTCLVVLEVVICCLTHLSRPYVIFEVWRLYAISLSIKLLILAALFKSMRSPKASAGQQEVRSQV